MDCLVIFLFLKGGPVGSADVDCNETSNVLCMFPTTSECYKLSKESKNFLFAKIIIEVTFIYLLHTDRLMIRKL